jgi:hypothetical protein
MTASGFRKLRPPNAQKKNGRGVPESIDYLITVGGTEGFNSATNLFTSK